MKSLKFHAFPHENGSISWGTTSPIPIKILTFHDEKLQIYEIFMTWSDHWGENPMKIGDFHVISPWKSPIIFHGLHSSCVCRYNIFANGFFIELVVRSHEVKDEGYEVDHGGKLITVFSAPGSALANCLKSAWRRAYIEQPHATYWSVRILES